MNNTANIKGKFTYTVFGLILVLTTLAVLIKPIMRHIYPVKFESYIEKYSEMYGIDKYLIMGIISTESKFDEEAVSHKDARGLMQLKDETAQWCVEKFDIDTGTNKNEQNINIGCAYLDYLISKYDGNTTTALAAYNAGEGNVSKWLKEQGNPEGYTLSDIPFGETDTYVKKVKNREKIYKFLY